ncbi:MAG: winged helix-turn-helix domain-containing protein [Candidatus Bathyarchaeota archaeon]|nr:winged helix-turn-helix domain-containing protein [Candidatus Bathyarchaeota archaeon]
MDLDAYSKEKLWELIVETVHANPMYPTNKAYTRDTLLPENPDITATELAERLNMPTAQALVILEELKEK